MCNCSTYYMYIRCISIICYVVFTALELEEKNSNKECITSVPKEL